MNILFDKSLKSINIAANKRLKEAGFDINPGSVVKLISSLVNEEIATFYELLSEAHRQAFVSTATGEYLDAIALIFNCKRREKETDDAFKGRLISQIQLLTTSNEESIRLHILENARVRDVMLKKYTHGVGTFSVVPVFDTFDVSDNEYNNIKSIVEEACAYGTKCHILKPTLLSIELQVKLVLRRELSVNDDYAVKKKVKENLKSTILKLKVGEPLIIAQLVEVIMGSSEDIYNFTCEKFLINGEVTSFSNQLGTWDSIFLEADAYNAIDVL